jgi:hypothetical protein
VGRTAAIDCRTDHGGIYGVGGYRRRAVIGEAASGEQEARWRGSSMRLRHGQRLVTEACIKQTTTTHRELGVAACRRRLARRIGEKRSQAGLQCFARSGERKASCLLDEAMKWHRDKAVVVAHGARW